MKNQFMRVEEVAQELEVSRSYAYRLIRQLNAELHEKGYMTIAGRVNRLYFQERLYGTSNQKECDTISCLKYRWNPFSARDAFNDSCGQIFDCKT